jgi:hypothetical protein
MKRDVAAFGSKRILLGAVAALLAERTEFEIADDGSIAVQDTGAALEAVVGDWVIGPEAAPFRGPTGAGDGRAPSPAGKRKSEMTNSEKGAYIAKHGLVAYQQLS